MTILIVPLNDRGSDALAWKLNKSGMFFTSFVKQDPHSTEKMISPPYTKPRFSTPSRSPRFLKSEKFSYGHWAKKIFEKIWFVELNLCWCCIYVDLMWCGSISSIWSSDSLLTGCLCLIWGWNMNGFSEIRQLFPQFYIMF